VGVGERERETDRQTEGVVCLFVVVLDHLEHLVLLLNRFDEVLCPVILDES
jgi:hypothetical protein